MYNYQLINIYNRLNIELFGLNSWVGRSGGNTAVVVLVSGHLDESLVTPASTPRVLDDPVVLASSIAVITDRQHTVVESGLTAHQLVVDTVRVELE